MSRQDAMMQSPQDILVPGTRLKLHNFGFAHVRKLYIHPKEKEWVCDVSTDGGQDLHLSLKYAVSVIYEG